MKYNWRYEKDHNLSPDIVITNIFKEQLAIDVVYFGRVYDRSTNDISINNDSIIGKSLDFNSKNYFEIIYCDCKNCS